MKTLFGPRQDKEAIVHLAEAGEVVVNAPQTQKGEKEATCQPKQELGPVVHEAAVTGELYGEKK